MAKMLFITHGLDFRRLVSRISDIVSVVTWLKLLIMASMSSLSKISGTNFPPFDARRSSARTRFFSVCKSNLNLLFVFSRNPAYQDRGYHQLLWMLCWQQYCTVSATGCNQSDCCVCHLESISICFVVFKCINTLLSLSNFIRRNPLSFVLP